MNVPWQFFIFITSIILFNVAARSDSRKICEQKFNFCTDSICNCPEGLKPNKNKTCCVHICEDKCIGGKCVAKNLCKCLPGYTATETRNVCEPFCSNCTNGYCYGYEKCAKRRFNDKPKLQLDMISLQNIHNNQCQVTNPPSAISTEEKSTTIAHQDKSTRRSNNNLDVSEEIVSAVPEEQKTSLAPTVKNNLIQILKGDTPQFSTLKTPTESNVLYTPTTKSAPIPDYVKFKELLEFLSEISNDASEETSTKKVWEQIRKHSIENYVYSMVNEELSKTSQPNDESNESSILLKNSDNSNEIQFFDRNQIHLVSEFRVEDPEKISMLPVEKQSPSASTPTRSENLISGTGIEDRHKYFSKELRMTAVPLGVGMFIGIGIVGLLVGNHYRNRQRSYAVLLK